MDIPNLVIDLRRRLDLLENTPTVFVNVEPKNPKTSTIWIDSGSSKFWDGSNWVIGGGGSLTDWNTSVIFTASDYRTIAWASGVVSVGTTDSKTDYSTTSGNFTMTTTTYFYWQSDMPTTIQTTTTAGAVVVGGGILLAVGRLNPDTANKASLKAFGGPTVDQIIADEIVANSITANMIQANAITASKLATTLLYAGAITLDTNGLIKGGQTAYDTGTGFFLGYSTSTYKLSIGNSAGNKLLWDGTTLSITGTLTATTGTIGGFTIGSTTISAVSGGNTTTLSSGATAFSAGPTGSPTITITQAGVLTSVGGTITGGTIQTATSGQRIVMASNVFTSYDSSGVARFMSNGSGFRLVDSTNTRNTDVIGGAAIGSLPSMDIDGGLYSKAIVGKIGVGCNIYTYGGQITFQGYGGSGNGITLSSTIDSTLVLSGTTITLNGKNLYSDGTNLYWNGVKIN